MEPRADDVIVIGGGISGLAVAQALLARGVPRQSLRVLDAAPHPGGYVGTDREGGWLVERAVNGFLTNAPATLALAEAAGLRGDVIQADPAAARRYVVRRGRLVPLPSKPPQVLTTPALSLGARLRLLREPFVRAPALGEESVSGFAARRLGEGTRDLADAFVTGVFAGDPEALSLDHAFPALREMERMHGSLLRGLKAAPRPPGGPARLTSFRGGMGALVDALAAQIPLDSGTTVHGIAGPGPFTVRTNRGDRSARAVVLALAPTAAAPLLGERFPPQRSAPIAVVALGFPQEAIARDVGFGYLAPRSEGRFALGAVAESNLFPDRAPPGHVLLRCLVGGVRDPEKAALPESELIGRTVADLQGLGIVTAQPVFTRVIRHRVGIPQIEVGHGRLLDAAAASEAARPGLFLTGAGYRSVAVNGLVAEAQTVASRVAAHLGLKEK